MGECPDFLHLSLFLKGEKAEQSLISAHTASTAQSPRGPLTWLCQTCSLLTQQCATQLCVMHTPSACGVKFAPGAAPPKCKIAPGGGDFKMHVRKCSFSVSEDLSKRLRKEKLIV